MPKPRAVYWLALSFALEAAYIITAILHARKVISGGWVPLFGLFSWASLICAIVAFTVGLKDNKKNHDQASLLACVLGAIYALSVWPILIFASALLAG